MVGNDSATEVRIDTLNDEVMGGVHSLVDSHYRSTVVQKIRSAGGILRVGGITIRLAKEFGFCYGVERAIDLAYAAREKYPDQPIYILGEIIHNPDVNRHLKRMGIRFLAGKDKDASVDDLKKDDVVIVPAFGASVATMELLASKGCRFVDATCGYVKSVWKRVQLYVNERFTSIIHGKAWHEETLATSSRISAEGKGHYLVIFTLEETDYVCDYILHGGDKKAFLERFKGACSADFDPDVHLNAIGVANQTTMLSNETEEVQQRLFAAMVKKFGEKNIAEHFRKFDTICGATQQRQNALRQLLTEPLDLLLVLGGYNSSNTSHLAEMGNAVLPTYFIKGASELLSVEVIRHYDLKLKQEVEHRGWLPEKDEMTIGITAGASCPGNLIEETIKRLCELKGVSLDFDRL